MIGDDERLAKLKAEVEPDLRKLPQRFKQYIAALEHRLREFAEVQAQVGETRVIVEPYEGKLYLPDTSTVRFTFPDKRHKAGTTSVDVCLKSAYTMGRDDARDHLSLNAQGRLRILPDASNSVYVEVER